MKQDELFVAGLSLGASHRQRMITILRHYAISGRKLADIARPQILNRSLTTLKRYCAQEWIAFPDWVPRAMRSRKIYKRSVKHKGR
jgi:hypothetical protein